MLGPLGAFYGIGATMARRVSLSLLALTALLLLAGFWLNPWDHRLPIGGDAYLALWGRAPQTWLLVFTHGEAGPYRGGTTSMTGPDGRTADPDLVVNGMDGPGLFYRSIRSPNAAAWTFAISLWWFVAILSALPVVSVARRFVQRRSANPVTL